MRVFRKQFVVSNRPFQADETWRSLDLPDGWALSYQDCRLLHKKSHAHAYERHRIWIGLFEEYIFLRVQRQ